MDLLKGAPTKMHLRWLQTAARQMDANVVVGGSNVGLRKVCAWVCACWWLSRGWLLLLALQKAAESSEVQLVHKVPAARPPALLE